MREYANVRRNGLIAINLQEGDELRLGHANHAAGTRS